jgi:chromosome partitioning protein
MQTIAVITQKGGTGKTTVVLCLAVAAQQAGLQSLIVDLDPQASACNWADRRKSETPLIIDAQPARLANALQKAVAEGIDFAIVDTPARSEQAAIAAAKAADLIVIPCRPQIYDLETIPNTKEVIALAGGKPAIIVLNAVPTQWVRGDGAPAENSRLAQTIMAAQSQGIDVCPVFICQRATFGDSAALGQVAIEYEPESKAAEEIRLLYKSISRLVHNKQRLGVNNGEEARSRRRAV